MGYLPDRDEALLTWALKASSTVNAQAALFGVPTATATAFVAKTAAFQTAMSANAEGLRNRVTVSNKDAAKKSLRAQAGLVNSLVQGTSTASDAMKYEAGFTVRRLPVPVPAPDAPPAFELVSIVNNTATFKAHDASGPSTRRKPDGVSLLSVFSHVGPSVPVDAGGWTLNGSTGKTSEVPVAFDPSLPMGTKAFVCAFWSTSTGLNGPACAPVEVILLGGAAQPVGVERMKLAA